MIRRNNKKIFKKYEVVIIGAGPAGLAAVLGAKDNGAEKILLIDRHKWLGGLLQQCIHPGFGLKRYKLELTGPEYAHRNLSEIKDYDINFLLDTTVLDITRDKRITLINTELGIEEVESESVIFAMGCRERTRGNINIPGFRPAGVFTAGTAQRLMNIDGLKVGNKIVILGSGDIGLIMARRCTIEGAKVEAVIEILDRPSGLRRNVVQCLEDFNIPLFLNHTITFIKGKERIEGIKFTRINKSFQCISKSERFIECDTLLLSVGLIPEIELLNPAGIKIDPRTGGPFVDNLMQVSLEGFFACGNLVQVYDLADYASIDGYQAGKNAALFSQGKIAKGRKKVILNPGKGIKSIVPQTADTSIEAVDSNIYIRVTEYLENPRFIFKNSKDIVFEKKLPYAIPSEMVVLSLNKNIFKQNSDEIIEIEVVS